MNILCLSHGLGKKPAAFAFSKFIAMGMGAGMGIVSRQISTKRISSLVFKAKLELPSYPVISFKKQTSILSSIRNYARWEQHTKVDYGVRGRWSDGSRDGGRRKKPKFNFDPSPNTVVYGIIGLNVAVFGLWKYGEARWKSFGDSRLTNFMYDNFTFTVEKFKQGKIWTAITSEFSHFNLTHLLFNMIALYSVGPDLARLLGPRRFLVYYTLSCLTASGTVYAYNSYLAPRLFNKNLGFDRHISLGSSGAVVSSVVLFATLFPQTKFLLFFVIPCPAWLAAAGFVGFDIYNSLSRTASWIGSSAHLGGAAAGFSYYWFYLRHRIRRF